MSIDPKLLKVFASRKLNVLLSGKHGVGKTALIKEVFTEVFGPMNEKWLYFSASTMDPWTDFVGIPKNYTRPDGVEVFKIIPPETFADGSEIEAMFFDEINRADPKTLNAIMELIQFKSINGRPFPKLKVIWAAENPASEGTYMVQPLDPAQKDRFEIQIDIPYELSETYFVEKFGHDVFGVVKKWWAKNKETISPRKLETVISGWESGIGLHYFSNECKTFNELSSNLSSLSFVKEARNIIKDGSKELKERFFTLDKIRKHGNVISEHRDIMSEAWQISDKETRNLIESMGFVPEISIEDLQLSSEEKDEIEKIKKIIDSNVYGVSNFSPAADKFIHAALFVNSNFGKYVNKKATAQDYALVEQIVKNHIGVENVLIHMFGKDFKSSELSSAQFSIMISQKGSEFWQQFSRFMFIILRGYHDLTSEYVVGFSKFNGSNLMSKHTKRNPSRTKRCMSQIYNKNADSIAVMYSDYSKLFRCC